MSNNNQQLEEEKEEVLNFDQLCRLVSEKVAECESDQKDLPFAIGRIANEMLWEEYLERDDVPYPSKFLDVFNLTIYIIELPYTSIHEYISSEIFVQLCVKSKLLCSVGSGCVAHMQADGRIRPRRVHSTRGFPANNCGTLIIEVGISQHWSGDTGLDRKAQKWYNVRDQVGVQYILCVKIDMTDQAITGAQHKLFDVQAWNAVQVPVDFMNGACLIEFDVRRVLGIPAGIELPSNIVKTI
jgi:hypothetical protein